MAISNRTPNTIAAMAALLAALRQLGGRFARAARVDRADAGFAVDPRVLRLWAAFSIVPAAVPRCLRLRFFLACAISLRIVVRSRSAAARDRSCGSARRAGSRRTPPPARGPPARPRRWAPPSPPPPRAVSVAPWHGHAR